MTEIKFHIWTKSGLRRIYYSLSLQSYTSLAIPLFLSSLIFFNFPAEIKIRNKSMGLVKHDYCTIRTSSCPFLSSKCTILLRYKGGEKERKKEATIMQKELLTSPSSIEAYASNSSPIYILFIHKRRELADRFGLSFLLSQSDVKLKLSQAPVEAQFWRFSEITAGKIILC